MVAVYKVNKAGVYGFYETDNLHILFNNDTILT